MPPKHVKQTTSPRFSADKRRHEAPDGHDGGGECAGDDEVDLVWSGLEGSELVCPRFVH